MPETREEFMTRIQAEWVSAEAGQPEETSLSCAYCGATLTEETKVEHSGVLYCARCFERRFQPCHYCGVVHRTSQMVRGQRRDEDGDRVSTYACPECMSEMNQCNNCSCFISGEEHDAHNGYCSVCYDDLEECDSCGTMMMHDNMRRVGDQMLCPSCYQSRTDVIRNYSYKPRPNFLPDSRAKWYYGLEQEHDHKRGYSGDEDDVIQSASELASMADDQFYIKHDGSLSNGYELVTHPATLDYHLNVFPWEQIAKIAISHDMRAHDTDTAGLHIHASRTRFGDDTTTQDLNIAKVMLLFELFWDKKIVPFSRRTSEALRNWACKPGANFEQNDSEPLVIMKSKRNVSNGERHTAINLMNEKTVEFRVFRGTLKASTIKATLQWLDTLISYAIDTNLRDIWDSDWDNIFAGTEYPELKAYLSDRHLIEGDM